MKSSLESLALGVGLSIGPAEKVDTGGSLKKEKLLSLSPILSSLACRRKLKNGSESVKEVIMNFPDYYSYTATFSHDDDGWLVEFPDLDRCATNAETLDEAIIQANNILEDYMAILERDHVSIPAPTPYDQIKAPTGGDKQRIVVSMHNARSRWQNKTVKKTVTLPTWIVQVASEKGINLSALLQDALMKTLKIIPTK